MRIFGIEVTAGKSYDRIAENLADVERKLEDLGWIGINQPTSLSSDYIKESYSVMVRRCRTAYFKNPIIAQAVHLTTWYTFGQGISAPKSQDEEIQEIISTFWKDRDNVLAFTGEVAQQKISNKLQYDGEIYYALQVDVDGSVYVRLYDPVTIVNVVFDPNDNMRPLFYKRIVNQKPQYTPDYENGAAHLRKEAAEQWAEMLKRLDIKDNEVLENVFCYHVHLNSDILDKRGVPEVYRALDWMNAHSGISGDMSTFIRSQAQYAWNKKVKGSKNQIQGMKAAIAQNANLTNPSRMAGSTLIENELVTTEPINLSANAGPLFETGIRRTLLMVAAAFGMMEHYFGDPSTGNLATATAMELPMLKKFQARQKFWEGVYLTVLNFQIDMKMMALNRRSFDYNPMKNRISVSPARDFADRTIDVDFPPIIEKDLKMIVDAMDKAKRGQLIPVETAQRLTMMAAGVNNIDEEMEKEFSEPEPVQPFGGFGGGALAKESVKPAADFGSRRNTAVRLADKNKEVIRKMNGYLKEIGAVYRKMYARVVEDATTTSEGKRFKGVLPNWEKDISVFEKDMQAIAKRYLPIAARMGEAYVKSHSAVRESKRIAEAAVDAFIDEQLQWNEKHLIGMTEDMKKKLRALLLESYDTEKEFFEAIEKGVLSYEKRVGSYASAFWTVEERAVREAGDPDTMVNFIGVQDGDNCDDCSAAIGENPHRLSEAPTPGEQQCLGNCRHALQIVDDEQLTESDIEILRDAEKEARRGYKLIDIRSQRN
jgi:hypothetical protein